MLELNSPNGNGSVILDMERGSGRFLSLSTESALNVFKRTTINRNPLVNNVFNLFQFVEADLNGKFRYASFGSPKHIITSRRAGCVWNPKNGSIDFVSGEIVTSDLEVQNETCPDAVWNSCWKSIAGKGLDSKDFYATTEGATLIRQLIDGVFEGIGNGIADLVWFGMHPLIETANTSESYLAANITQTEWDLYYDQMQQTGGILTIVDSLKANGENNYTVDIGSYVGSEYTGATKTLFDNLLKRRPTQMRLYDNRATSPEGRSAIYVSRSVYQKYFDDVIAQNGNIPETFYLFLQGEDGKHIRQRGVLEYKGHYVVEMDEWDMLGDMTNTYTHRAILTVPRNFAIAATANRLDADGLANQYNGMGMEVIQRLGAPYQGKVYMNAMFELGTALIDQDYVINASETVSL